MLGERLRKERDRVGMTQIEVARHIGVSSTAYYYFEKNLKTPSLEKAKALAELFQVSLDYLVGNDDKPAN